MLKSYTDFTVYNRLSDTLGILLSSMKPVIQFYQREDSKLDNVNINNASENLIVSSYDKLTKEHGSPYNIDLAEKYNLTKKQLNTAIKNIDIINHNDKEKLHDAEVWLNAMKDKMDQQDYKVWNERFKQA